MTKNEFIKIKIEYLLRLLYAPRGSAYRVNLCVFFTDLRENGDHFPIQH